jgi:hypothetical protein
LWVAAAHADVSTPKRSEPKSGDAVSQCGEALKLAQAAYERASGKSGDLSVFSQVLFYQGTRGISALFIFADPTETRHPWRLRDRDYPWAGYNRQIRSRAEAHALGEVDDDDELARWFVPALDRCFALAAAK